ncbi:hypothetical protein HYALB_00006979 [Hymenoscyphus albidus]|uniref:Arabinan endo-1,5-alpha-L-arabinosidase n=1 Tax=Hymenoscyphus albidus TaxID=595503 RepID=A0A9N9PSN2_9HELO|nr:hypothetical protein HYALB_00006979 [Hymenoscyphus albidus]
MSSVLRYLYVVSLALASLVQGYSDPGPCSGACWAHDPALIQHSDGTYFKFNTGKGIEIVTASSLAGPWTIQGSVLPSGSKISSPGNKDLWAPDVTKVGDLYHLYYSVSQFGAQVSSIGLATSPSMKPGSWSDLGAVGVDSKAGTAYNAIDANLLKVGSDYQLVFGSFWGGIFTTPLASDAKKAAGGSPKNIAFKKEGENPSEGAYVFHYSGFYYLTWSFGKCCGLDSNKPAPGGEYKILVCRSESATGGFVDKAGVSCTAGGGTTLLESHGKIYAPGGQGVFQDSKQGLVLYYHYANTDVGLGDGQYLFGYNALKWSGGWPSV